MDHVNALRAEPRALFGFDPYGVEPFWSEWGLPLDVIVFGGGAVVVFLGVFGAWLKNRLAPRGTHPAPKDRLGQD